MTYGPIPASGAGADLFDQPSLFYLTNQALIEEWGGLKVTVAAALDDWFSTTLREALELPAAELGLRVSPAIGPSSWRHVVLHTPDATFQSGKPVIGVGLAWPLKSANPSANSVFTCVRCSRTATGRLAAAAFLDAGGRAARSSIAQSKGNDDGTWPIWRWVRADGQWWTDLDGYLDVLVKNISEVALAVLRPLEAASTTPLVGASDEGDDAGVTMVEPGSP